MSDLFDAVDALLAQAAAEDDLPPPAERERLRKVARLTQKQVADALEVARETVVAWEKGRSEPRSPQRQAYARLLDGLAARYPTLGGAGAGANGDASADPDTDASSHTDTDASADANPDADAESGAATRFVAAAASESGLAPDPDPEPDPEPTEPDSVAESTPAPTPTPEPAPVAPPTAEPAVKPTPTPAPVAVPAARFPGGPLAVLDADGATLVAHLTGGRTLPCRAKSLAAVVAWALEAGLGAERLHRAGRDADPLVVLTAAAAARLGLPDELEDRRNLRLPEDHKLVKQVTKDGWKLTRRGFGPWTKVYKPVEVGRRQCVQFAILPWGALDSRSWGDAESLPAARLADVLGGYAERVLTPRGSTAVAGLALMTELRPPTQAVKDTATGTWRSGPVPGSLTDAVDPAPPEAPDEHPVAQTRDGADVLVEEAYDWYREIHLVGNDEGNLEHAVGLDVNAAFLAAASRLPVGLGPPVYVEAPTFDKRLPGCWYVDLSGIAVDPRLPSPFTPNGLAPTGPGWYATPTVAYAVELGAAVDPFEAWIRPEYGSYLDPWYGRLREAYLATMADLGVTADLDEAGFLAAMARHKQVDPGRAVVLSAIKATVKGGIGKLRERPQGARYKVGDRWPALERPTWRPDIRAAVIANARIGMHRKMRKLAAVADLYPLAVLSDCVVYPSAGPSPLDVLPRGADGKPVPGAFRLGVSPGMVKHEGTRSLEWALGLLVEGHNPARHIKDGVDAVAEGE
ncbi:telomere-associated protein Tap [Embleya sp. NBC_00896]|uniref:telomere-associated protein Tap n=1 Tax=Embleya sp. NBC_00896 TaxID=2975961 RepID=UPI002F90FAE1|nr:helix-turn-helix domain-containing protein [Embleya sp. NBC_00896]